MGIGIIPTSKEDRQAFGRMIRSIDGAYGTGILDEDDVGLDGHMHIHIPIREQQVRDIWRLAKLNKEHPKSTWHTIGNYKEYVLEIKVYKMRTGLFSKPKWLVNYEILLGGLSDDQMHQVQNIGFSGAKLLSDLFAIFDSILLRGEWPVSDSAEQALSV